MSNENGSYNNNRLLRLHMDRTQYCLDKDREFLKGKTNNLNKILFTLERKNVQIEETNCTYDCVTQLISYGDSVYCIEHTYKGIWKHTLSILLRSKADLCDIYEYTDKYKPVPTWLTLIEFVKECTTVEF
jgi:hypothetical protein